MLNRTISNPKSKAINSLFNNCRSKIVQLTTWILFLIATHDVSWFHLLSKKELHFTVYTHYMWIQMEIASKILHKACLGTPELKKLGKHFWDTHFWQRVHLFCPTQYDMEGGNQESIARAAWWHNRLLKIKQKVFLSDSVWHGRRSGPMDLPGILKFPPQ